MLINTNSEVGDKMTMEEKVVAEIREILQKHNCVLVLEYDYSGFGRGEAALVKVVQHKDGQTTSDGAILHSE